MLSEEAGEAPFITKRLRLIIAPESAKPHVLRGSRKLTGKRGAGALRDFLDLPLDVIYEIVSFLEPPDLLNLARLTKDFRSLFLSRSSIVIWKRVLSQVPDLPPCPEDLCEPEYASLMYDKFCMACVSNRGIITSDFKVRLRLCVSCSRNNYIFEFGITTPIIEDALKAIPASFSEILGDFLEDEPYDSNSNNVYCEYFYPEFSHVIDKLVDLVDNEPPEAYDQFLSVQKRYASRMMTEGKAMLMWKAEAEYGKECTRNAIVDRRRADILELMQSLGWDPQYFPLEVDGVDYDEWGRYFNQPKAFSMRSWNSIKEKLSGIYVRCHRSRHADDLYEMIARKYQLYRREQPFERRKLIPSWPHVSQLPILCDLVDENCLDWSDETILEVIHVLVDESWDFFPRVRARLADTIKGFDPSQENRSDDEILSRAANLYLCGCGPCQTDPKVKSYPEVVDHVINQYPMEMWDTVRPQTQGDLIETAENVLEMLGLSKNSTKESLEKFTCGCGHHLYAGPLSFGQLVEHVYNQQNWHALVVDYTSPGSAHLIKDLLVESHSFERLRTLVSVINSDSATSEGRDKENDTDTPAMPTAEEVSSDIPHGRYCRSCYRLRLRAEVVNEMGSYHMKIQHGRDMQADDFEEYGVLATLYGEA